MEELPLCEGQALASLKGIPRSWLAERTSESASWGVGCIACSAAQTGSPFAKFTVCTLTTMIMANFKKHQASKMHRQAVAAFLSQKGITVGPSSGQIVVGAPPLDQFHQLWKLISEGHAPRNGLEGIGAQCKLQRMLSCLCEAMRRDDADFLSCAKSIALFRDERHARLEIRFCACDGKLNRRHKLLGIRRHFGTGALAITQATKDVVTRACTRNFGMCPRRGEPLPNDLDNGLLNHIRNHVHAVAVDSAGDEVASVRDMMDPAYGDPFTPNVEALLRDKAHGARRCISRPWTADAKRKDIMQFYIQSSNSMIQTIDRSLDLRRMLTINIDALLAGIRRGNSKLLISLRSAKHRYESLASPLGNFVLHLVPIVKTSLEITVVRTGSEVACAKLFLVRISNEHCLIIALLADAADDGLELTRSLDSFDKSDPASLSTEVYLFCIRIVEMYVNGKILKIASYTAYMIDQLRDNFLVLPVDNISGNGGWKSIGGELSEDVLQKALRTMGAWVKLGIRVIQAEFPDWELLQSFAVLDASLNSDDDICDTKIAKLAHAFGLDPVALANEMCNYRHIAMHLKKNGEVSDNFTAWATAIHKAEQKQIAHRKSPNANLRTLLYRYGCLRACTSRVEQDFTNIKAVFGDCRLHASEEYEHCINKIVLDRPSEEPERNLLVQKAQEIWHECYGQTRSWDVGARRLDLGSSKKRKIPDCDLAAGELCQKDWLRRRRLAACQIAVDVPRQEGCVKIKAACDADLGDLWTPGHEKESELQRKKGDQRLREAYILRHLVPCEHDAELVDAAAAQHDHNRGLSLKLYRQRALQQKRIKQGSCPDVAGKTVYVDETASLSARGVLWIGNLGLRQIHEIHPDDLPHIGVTKDPSAPSKDLDFIFRLCGGTSIRPNFFNRRSALHDASLHSESVVTYAPAIHHTRELWVSDRFQNNNPEVFCILKKIAIDKADSKWMLLDSAEMFELAKTHAIKKKKSSSVLGLATTPEVERITQMMPKQISKHVMDLDAFLQYVTRFDMDTSVIGWRRKTLT